MAHKFYTAKGRLNVYSFACGYQERRELPNGIEVTLWHEGGPCYHVRSHDHATGKRIFWESFPHLTEARRLFDAQGGRLAVSTEGAAIARAYRNRGK